MKKVNLSGRICNDMVAEIFSRVPFKTLIRLKCLSKSVASFIEDPSFIELYPSEAKPFVVIPYDRDRCDYEDLEFFSVNSVGVATHMLMYDAFYIDRSCEFRFCNGLVCLHYSSPELCIFNPYTKEVIILPVPNEVNRISFGFEFGFDPSIGKYKVLIWSLNTCWDTYEILTLGVNQWRTLSCTKPACMLLGSEHVCANGMVYFSGSDGILYMFNLAYEVFNEILRPDKFSQSSSSYVMELRESPDPKSSLCLIDIERHPSEDMLDIWILSKEATVEQSWVQMAERIPMPPECSRIHVPFYVGNGEILLGFTHQEEDQYHDIYLYNLLSKQFHRRKVVGIPMRDFVAVDYVKSSVRIEITEFLENLGYIPIMGFWTFN